MRFSTWAFLGAHVQGTREEARKERFMVTDHSKLYDVTIIGGGPAGMTAALYASRARLSTLIIEHGLWGGQMTTTETIDNYPGFPQGVSGEELSRLMEDQAKRFGAETVSQWVSGVALEGDTKAVKTDGGNYRSRALIVCTGAEYRRLGIPGEAEYIGRGVSFCATCDGAFFKDASIVVVGGGDSALTEALFLTKFVKELTIIHRRDALRATKIYQERAFANPKIKFLWNSVVQEVKGDTIVRSVAVRNVKTGEVTELATEGVFMFVGLLPRTDFMRGTVAMSDGGYIVTNENCETSVKGIFAAGDCREKLLRQVATAVGDGAVAAFAVEKYLEEKG